MKTDFNLSEWALRHRSLVWYFMGIFAVMGVVSYLNLGREEDPSFTIKTMLIQAQWPGASVDEMSKQVTERIERKLEELDVLDYTKSMTMPGQTIVLVYLRDATKARDVPHTWMRVRNMMNDIRADFPSGVTDLTYNDTFGDVFGNIYAFTADGLTQRQLRDYVEHVRREVLLIPNVGKVDLIGAQDEVIYAEFSVRQMAALGLDQQDILRTIQAQNAVVPSGVVEAGPERIVLRVGGQFISEESLRAINLRVNDRFFRLSDFVTLHPDDSRQPGGQRLDEPLRAPKGESWRGASGGHSRPRESDARGVYPSRSRNSAGNSTPSVPSRAKAKQ